MDKDLLKFNINIDNKIVKVMIYALELTDTVYVRAEFVIDNEKLIYTQKPIPKPRDQIDQRRIYDAAMSYQAYLLKKMRTPKTFLHELLEVANESVKQQDYTYVMKLCQAMLYFDKDFIDAKNLLARVNKEYESYKDLMGKEFTFEHLKKAIIYLKDIKTDNEVSQINQEQSMEKFTTSWNRLKIVFDSDIKKALRAFQKAYDHSRRKEYSKAIEEYRKSIYHRPDFGAAYLNLGVLLSRQDDVEHAIESYHKARENGVDSPFLFYNYGIAYSKMKEPEKAINNYEIAIKKAPRYQKAIDNLIEIFLEYNIETPKLLSYCNRLKELNPKNIKPYILRYEVFIKLQDFKNALQELQSLQKIHKNPEILFNIAVLFLLNNKPNEAVEQFEGCAGIFKESFKDCYYNIILINYYNKDFFLTNEYLSRMTAWMIHKEGLDNTFIFWEDLLNILDNPVKLSFTLAKLYLDNNEKEMGIKKLKEIISKGFDFIPAMELLADQHHEMGDLDDAAVIYKEIVNIDNRNDSSYLKLGIISAEKQNYEEAIHYWKKCLDINPNSADAHYRLGLSYAQLNHMVLALEEFNTVLRLDPKFPKIRDRINLIRKSMYGSNT